MHCQSSPSHPSLNTVGTMVETCLAFLLFCPLVSLGYPLGFAKICFCKSLGWEASSGNLILRKCMVFHDSGCGFSLGPPPRIGEHLNLQKLGVKRIFRKSEFAKTGAFPRFVQWLFPRIPLGWGAMCLCNDSLLQNRVLLPFMVDTPRKFRHRDSNPGRSGEGRVS